MSDVKKYLLKRLKDLDQILHKYCTLWLDELVTFWRSWVQSQSRYDATSLLVKLSARI